MPHTLVDNRTPYAFEALQLVDEQAVAQCVTCVQATFLIHPEGLIPLAKQRPVKVGGEWRGDPAETSMVMEPQVAFIKQGTDVVLHGHAHAPEPGATESMIGIRVGPLQKTARVFGERRHTGIPGLRGISPPLPFERIPIIPERAFGGWDRRDPDPNRHACEPRNPVGRGFYTAVPEGDDTWLPNFEDPQDLITSWSDRPQPACFGFIGPEWHPRLAYGGTYNEAWSKSRKPLLPTDFDRRFFNAGSPGLVSPKPLRGDEEVVVMGCSPQRQRVAFRLPEPEAPVCVVELRGRKRVPLRTTLDTVIVDMDSHLLTLLWRACLPVRNGLHDVVAIGVWQGAHARDAAASMAA
ncbi:DUF2169 domain-containing protein [Variovorax rhizosphaerae]|uniref:DUF2169 domain-containing protein n=1 Tax=Variovorax rhizosphaerae TaxID=1836200 RepID=A0ABU8WS27_9BURK